MWNARATLNDGKTLTMATGKTADQCSSKLAKRYGPGHSLSLAFNGNDTDGHLHWDIYRDRVLYGHVVIAPR